MASFFKRFSDVIKSNINAMLDRSEDPEKMINQAVREMQTQIDKARSGVAKAVAQEKLLGRRLAERTADRDDWRAKAALAVDKGREDLARKALERANEADKDAASLADAHEKARAMGEKLRAQLRRLEEKLDEAKRRRGTLIARKRAADASKKVNETLGAMGAGKSAFSTFDRMEEKIDEMEAESQAYEELGSPGAELDEEFADLAGSADVEAQLAALKAGKNKKKKSSR